MLSAGHLLFYWFRLLEVRFYLRRQIHTSGQLSPAKLTQYRIETENDVCLKKIELAYNG